MRRCAEAAVGGPFVHRIDPVLGQIGGLYLWWYGLSYTLGFLQTWLFLRRHRTQLRLASHEVTSLALYFASGVLIGGRVVQVAFDDWPFYRDHPLLIPAVWLGGMATHGLLLGAAASTWLFCRRHGRSIRVVADALVVPGAFLMGIGRIGNFIDGQIVGSPTDVPWAVQFPDAAGFRHPVVLYDGLKNLLLVPWLLWIRRVRPTPGAAAAHFVFWYACLRVPVDLFREYPTYRLGVPTGQALNVLMAAVGAVLVVRSELRARGRLPQPALAPARARTPGRGVVLATRVAFVVLLLVALTLPSNWTQDVPARYAQRHPGLERTWAYPLIPARQDR